MRTIGVPVRMPSSTSRSVWAAQGAASAGPGELAHLVESSGEDTPSRRIHYREQVARRSRLRKKSLGETDLERPLKAQYKLDPT